MFKLSVKQRLAIKSYLHALPASITVYVIPYIAKIITSKTPHFNWRIFALAFATALLAPITRWLVRVYQSLVVKYPWLKPFFNKAIVKLKLTPAEAEFAKAALAAAKQSQTDALAKAFKDATGNTLVSDKPATS